MSITRNWYDADKTVIHILFDGEWTWADHHEALKEMSIMLDNAKQKVNIIVEFQNAATLSKGTTSQFHNARQFLQHENIGFISLIGLNMLMRFLLNIFFRFMPSIKSKIYLADTFDEGYGLVISSDS